MDYMYIISYYIINTNKNIYKCIVCVCLYKYFERQITANRYEILKGVVSVTRRDRIRNNKG